MPVRSSFLSSSNSLLLDVVRGKGRVLRWLHRKCDEIVGEKCFLTYTVGNCWRNLPFCIFCLLRIADQADVLICLVYFWHWHDSPPPPFSRQEKHVNVIKEINE